RHGCLAAGIDIGVQYRSLHGRCGGTITPSAHVDQYCELPNNKFNTIRDAAALAEAWHRFRYRRAAEGRARKAAAVAAPACGADRCDERHDLDDRAEPDESLGR